MRTDLYTKIVLTIIAVLLAMVAVRPYVAPDTVALAQGPFTGVQLQYEDGRRHFFDTRTGEIWMYDLDQPAAKFRLNKLGQALTKEQ